MAIDRVNKDIADSAAWQFIGKIRLMLEAVECANADEQPMKFATFFERTKEHLEVMDAQIQPKKAKNNLAGGTEPKPK